MTALKLQDTAIPIPDYYSSAVSSADLRDFSEDINEYRIKSFFINNEIEPSEPEYFDISISTNVLELKDQPLIAKAPTPRKFSYKFSNALQSWEGYVVEVYNKFFAARIKDLFGKSPDEDVEIPMKDVSRDDLHLVVPGGIFYWNVSIENISGSIQRSSVIRFRRLPRWTKKEIDNAKLFQEKISKLFLD